jgi:hypothetical protein
MAEFPAGGWNLDGYDVFMDWARALQILPANIVTRDIQSRLRKLSAQLFEVVEPQLQDGESSEEEPPSAPASIPVTSIKSRPPPPPGSFLLRDCSPPVCYEFFR